MASSLLIRDPIYPKRHLPMKALSNLNLPHCKMIASLVSIYLIWGTTYLALQVAVETIPPFLTIAVRYLAAGIILYTIARVSGSSKPTWKQWKHAAILGISVMGICNGIVAQIGAKVPSGTIACIFATGPFVLSMVAWIGKVESRPKLIDFLSMIFGMLGVFLLTLFGAQSSGQSYWLFAALLLLATLAWAIGTVWTKKIATDTPVALGSSMQMLWGGGFSLVISLGKGELSGFSIETVSSNTVLALSYLTIFGTIVAFVSYNYLLKTTDTSLVASHAYINPLVAIGAGALILGESFSYFEWLSAMLIIAAVFISISKHPIEKFLGGYLTSWMSRIDTTITNGQLRLKRRFA